MREYQRKRRAVKPDVKPEALQADDVKLVKPDVKRLAQVLPSEGLPAEWAIVRDYISRPGILERTQAICGALGKHSSQVWFGLGGLTAADIGKVIGTRPAQSPKGTQ